MINVLMGLQEITRDHGLNWMRTIRSQWKWKIKDGFPRIKQKSSHETSGKIAKNKNWWFFMFYTWEINPSLYWWNQWKRSVQMNCFSIANCSCIIYFWFSLCFPLSSCFCHSFFDTTMKWNQWNLPTNIPALLSNFCLFLPFFDLPKIFEFSMHFHQNFQKFRCFLVFPSFPSFFNAKK